MIYFDNAATTYPKPKQVIRAVEEAMIFCGANPGRSGNQMSYLTASKIFEVRESLSNLFNLNSPENVIFTKNCTEALNLVIHGLQRKGGHFLCSNYEHNSVTRPLQYLKEQNLCDWGYFEVKPSVVDTLKNIQNKIQKNTIAIICTATSNVTGLCMPIQDIATLAHQNGLKLIVDGAQGAGIIPVYMQKMNLDYLCLPGHKGLYGPMGTGALLCRNTECLKTLMQGGTGTQSKEYAMPMAVPERYESGTLNVPGIIGVGAGCKQIEELSIKKIYDKEQYWIRYLVEELKKMKSFELYKPNMQSYLYAPILALNIQNMHSEEVATLLAEDEIAVRGGFHCAPLAHKTLKTLDRGVVRICPSIFTTEKDVNCLLNSLFKIAKKR